MDKMENKEHQNSNINQENTPDTNTEQTNQNVSDNNAVENNNDNVEEKKLPETQEENSSKKESAADRILKKLNKKQTNEEENRPETEQKTSEDETAQTNQIETQENISNSTEESDAESATKPDYDKMTKQELVDELKRLINDKPVQEIRSDVESIKTQFYKKHKAEQAELKKKFVEAGNDPEDFKPEPDKLEETFKEYYKVFKEKRQEYNKKQEEERLHNLEKKYEIIQKINDLINSQETLNKTFDEFKNLQKQWQEIGPVPPNELKKLWDSYHFTVEKFYDYVKLNKELRDLDLKKNLEAKIELCVRAEELLLEPKVVEAFKELQKLHEAWREIGPVPREKKDEIWERFKRATSQINKKHQEYFDNIKKEQESNLKAKEALCEKVEEIADADLKTHKEWEEKSKEIIEIQALWRTIGFAPKKHNNKIYSRFRKACDKFFDRKREFYAQSREEQEVNMQKKLDLIVQAESLKDSTDWKKTTDICIELQKKWKEIGPVPRKHSDELWNRFRTACNHFFDRKKEYFKQIDAEQEENLKLKLDLIEEINNFELSEDIETNIAKLKEFQNRWTQIGHVPIKEKDKVIRAYKDAIDNKFSSLKIDDNKREEMRFLNRIENIKQSNNAYEKLRAEKEKIRSKLEHLNNKVVQWENNLGFFADTENAKLLMADFQKKMDRTKEQIESLKKHITIINKAIDELKKKK